ncbi:MAG: ATP-binding protein [Longimicrobiales bacterium]|nr:ATP-binding protein [Longimicrobiales bacterium]
MSGDSKKYLRRIEWRLPLGIAALLLVVVAVYSWAAYVQVRASAIDSARTRADDVARQLSALLAQSVSELHEEVLDAASDPALRSAMMAEPAIDPDQIASLLRPSLGTLSSLQRVEVWDRAGVLRGSVLDSAVAPPPDTAAPLFPQWVGGDTATVSGFRSTPSGLTYAVSAPIRNDTTTLGFLTYRLALSTDRETVEGLENLVGTGAAFRVGVPGGVWTDLADETDGPPAVIVGDGGREPYRSSDGRAMFGAGASVDGAPWVAWVEFPRDDVLSGPRALLSRIVLLGLLVVVLGSATGWMLSRRITSRLRSVTLAAGALASGDESTRVPSDGEDELAELARAFNRMADEVEGARHRLEEQVMERTAEVREREEELRRYTTELEATNHELDAFCYSVSHDLRAPLRAIDGFSSSVLREYGGTLDERGAGDLRRVCAAAGRMGRLIDDLLDLSRAARVEMRVNPVDLSALAERLAADFAEDEPDRQVEVRIATGLVAPADEELLRLVLGNLIGNAWKFTRTRDDARIEVARSEPHDAFFVRDNGAGFDMAYVDKLFDPFQRLHSDREFEGSGVGLALVQRIIHRHGGTVWGEGSTGEGATFYFTLPGA